MPASTATGCERALLPGSSISLAFLPGSGMARRCEQPEVAVVLVRAIEGVVAAHAVGVIDARQGPPPGPGFRASFEGMKRARADSGNGGAVMSVTSSCE